MQVLNNYLSLDIVTGARNQEKVESSDKKNSSHGMSKNFSTLCLCTPNVKANKKSNRLTVYGQSSGWYKFQKAEGTNLKIIIPSIQTNWLDHCTVVDRTVVVSNGTFSVKKNQASRVQWKA